MHVLEALRIISESCSSEQQINEALGFLNKSKDERFKKIAKLTKIEKIKRFIKITKDTKDGISNNESLLKTKKETLDNTDKQSQEQDGVDFTKHKYKSILSLNTIDGYPILIENNNEFDSIYYIDKHDKIKPISIMQIEDLIYKNEK